MPDLHLVLKGKHFLDVKSGKKPEEYRLVKDHWIKLIQNRTYDRVIIKWGYVPIDHPEKVLIFPYRGYSIKEIVHAEFGIQPVRVFAIRLNNA